MKDTRLVFDGCRGVVIVAELEAKQPLRIRLPPFRHPHLRLGEVRTELTEHRRGTPATIGLLVGGLHDHLIVHNVALDAGLDLRVVEVVLGVDLPVAFLQMLEVLFGEGPLQRAPDPYGLGVILLGCGRRRHFPVSDVLVLETLSNGCRDREVFGARELGKLGPEELEPAEGIDGGDEVSMDRQLEASPWRPGCAELGRATLSKVEVVGRDLGATDQVKHLLIRRERGG